MAIHRWPAPVVVVASGFLAASFSAGGCTADDSENTADDSENTADDSENTADDSESDPQSAKLPIHLYADCRQGCAIQFPNELPDGVWGSCDAPRQFDPGTVDFAEACQSATSGDPVNLQHSGDYYELGDQGWQSASSSLDPSGVVVYGYCSEVQTLAQFFSVVRHDGRWYRFARNMDVDSNDQAKNLALLIEDVDTSTYASEVAPASNQDLTCAGGGATFEPFTRDGLPAELARAWRYCADATSDGGPPSDESIVAACEEALSDTFTNETWQRSDGSVVYGAADDCELSPSTLGMLGDELWESEACPEFEADLLYKRERIDYKLVSQGGHDYLATSYASHVGAEWTIHFARQTPPPPVGADDPCVPVPSHARCIVE